MSTKSQSHNTNENETKVASQSQNQGQYSKSQMTSIILAISMIALVLLLLVGAAAARSLLKDKTVSCKDSQTECLVDNSDPTTRECISGSDVKDVPVNKFVAYYYEESILNDQLKCTQIVDEMAISYAWDEFHGIKSENFRVKYEGTMEFDQDTKKIITLNGMGKTKITVDGDLVLARNEGSSDQSSYTFTKGVHKIEVEYSNDWHTVDFGLFFDDVDTETGIGDLNTSEFGSDYDIYYVSVYEAKSGFNIDVDIKPRNKPYVLFLNSYEKVNWNIAGTDNNLKAVIINAYTPGSKVSGVEATIPTYKLDRMANNLLSMNYQIQPTCYPPAGSDSVPYCGDYDSLSAFKELETVFGFQDVYFSGEYSPSSIKAPGDKITQKILQDKYDEAVTKAKSGQTDPNEDCVKAGEDLICGGEGEDLIYY